MLIGKKLKMSRGTKLGCIQNSRKESKEKKKSIWEVSALCVVKKKLARQHLGRSAGGGSSF
jgi:hypothetical protein